MGQWYNLFFICMCSCVSKSMYMGVYMSIWRSGISALCFSQLLSILFLRPCLSLGPGTVQEGRLAYRCSPKSHLCLPSGFGITCTLLCGWFFYLGFGYFPYDLRFVQPALLSQLFLLTLRLRVSVYHNPIPHVCARDTCHRSCSNVMTIMPSYTR